MDRAECAEEVIALQKAVIKRQREALRVARDDLEQVLMAKPLWEGGVRAPSKEALSGQLDGMRDYAVRALAAIDAVLKETGNE